MRRKLRRREQPSLAFRTADVVGRRKEHPAHIVLHNSPQLLIPPISVPAQ
jgi:hypothetical protein